MLQGVFDAHGMLRARLDIDDDGWMLTVPETVSPTPFLTSHEGALTSSDIDAATTAAAAELAPEDGRMVRAVWYETPGVAGQLLLVIHHLVIDGVSWRILSDDLARAWADVSAGRPTRLDDVPTSFKTWSNTIAAAQFEAEAEHWNQVLATPDPDLGRRALDPAVDTANTVRSHSLSLPPDISSALLTSVPAAMYGGVNDVLLTAFTLALAQWRADRGHAESTATVVNLEGHGRGPLATAPTPT